MKCEIIWNSLSVSEWEERFANIERSTILQSYSYARAICGLHHQSARWGLIKIEGQEAGLVQLLEVNFLFNLFHGVILDRGPLWFKNFGSAIHVSSFFQTFNKTFPKRLGRKRRIIPEIETGMTIEKILTQTGLESVPSIKKYQTLWWDLDQDEDGARQNLRSNWRGSLQKAEKSGLSVIWDMDKKFYAWTRQVYSLDKKIKGFEGVSPKLLDNLALFSTSTNPMVIGKVSVKGQDIATMLFICHGQSATYQVGWSSEEGRKLCAHHFILWQARSMLQSLGIRHLDLGGVNDEAAKNIKKFKEGTGAKPITLVGHYS